MRIKKTTFVHLGGGHPAPRVLRNESFGFVLLYQSVFFVFFAAVAAAILFYSRFSDGRAMCCDSTVVLSDRSFVVAWLHFAVWRRGWIIGIFFPCSIAIVSDIIFVLGICFWSWKMFKKKQKKQDLKKNVNMVCGQQVVSFFCWYYYLVLLFAVFSWTETNSWL